MDNLPGKFSRSGGPRSVSGKLTASRNAMKSGAYAKCEFIDGETEEQLENLRQVLYEDLNPKTSVECVMVEDILRQLWRKYRVERYASKVLKSLYEKEVTKNDVIGDLGVDALQMFKDIEDISDDIRQNGKAFYANLLKQIQAVQLEHPVHCADLSVFKREYVDVYRLMQKLSHRPECLDDWIKENKANQIRRTFWQDELRSLEVWAKKWITCFESEAKILQSISRIQSNRIYQQLISEDVTRATDDVGRALHRSLNEYYKERDRHRKDSALIIEFQADANNTTVINDVSETGSR